MSRGPAILIVADAGPAVGGGHVMRCLTLAAALDARGARCVFLASPGVETVLAAFAPDTPRIGCNDGSPEALTVAALGLADSFHAFAFDHYRLGESEHHRVSGAAPVLVIDDLADRPLGADLVLDAGPGRRAEDYRGLAPPEARLLLGPGFAPVREAFQRRREASLARRRAATGVARVLISLGLTDLGGVTGWAVEQTLAAVPRTVRVDAVVGAAAPSLPGLWARAAEEPRLRLHVDTSEMADLMAVADLAVGAGGSTSWERCVLGLPTLLLVLAENQRPAAQALAAAGAVLTPGPAGEPYDNPAFAQGLASLISDPQARRALGERAAALCDGKGAQRTAEAFLELIA